MKARVLPFLFLCALISSCNVMEEGVIDVKLEEADKVDRTPASVSISALSVSGDQLELSGENFAMITEAIVTGPASYSKTFAIVSATETTLIIKTTEATDFTLGTTYNLVLSDGTNETTFSFSFVLDSNSVVTASLQDGSVTPTKLASMGAVADDILMFSSGAWGRASRSTVRGDNFTNPASSCLDAKNSGMDASGRMWIDPAGNGSTLKEVYCDQETDGGGWMMVLNSVFGSQTNNFWYILKADALGRKGVPEINRNFYDGALYTIPPGAYTIMDRVADQQGKVATLVVATVDGIDSNSASGTFMHFINPAQVSGDASVYNAHIAGGWSAPDHDGDTYGVTNCSSVYTGVTQHYSNCWAYNLGADADGAPYTDGYAGPHVATAPVLTPLGLSNDGTNYSRVGRITRFIKW